MADLLQVLESLNRKERFFLIGQALGNPGFTISESFRKLIADSLGLSVPANPFAAIDYHLDWLYASLYLAFKDKREAVHSNGCGLVTANQEDVDFLVAYKDGEVYHVVLLEAKGATGFTNHQMTSKAARLGSIFGPEGDRWESVVPHFAIVSRRPPQQLRLEDWPTWMKRPDGTVSWMPLQMPRDRDLVRVERCDETGKPSQGGQYWHAVQ